MRLAPLALLPLGFLPIVSSTPSEQRAEADEVTILFGVADLPEPTTTIPIAAPPTSPPSYAPADVPLAPTPPVLTQDLSVYIMRTADPETLIRWYWRDTPDVAVDDPHR